MVRAERLTKRFKAEGETREILKNVSLSLAAGESVAIMGPSGSGKTTLLNILGTLDTPTSGSVDLFGSDPFKLGERELALFRNSMIGFIFQSHHLLPQCSVIENVLLPAIVSQPKASSANGRTEAVPERAARLLERVGLKARMDDRPGKLSGGERQRAAVVRALINSPRMVLADEPTGSLDHASADAIGTLLVDLKKEENVALIVVTHAMDLARRMDRTLQLRDGALVE